MTRLRFVKMHGAGNDFVMVDGCALPGGDPDAAAIAAVCDRRRGVGADGLIVVRPSLEADFAMTYYNRDGQEADLCGNGARCTVAFARRLGLFEGARCRFLTRAGSVRGSLAEEGISVTLPPPRALRTGLALAGSPHPEHVLADTGVPHLVIVVDDPAEVDLGGLGPRLRGHPDLGPEGANVDWVARLPRDGAHAMRTYERGVEAETLACGTGAVACALVLVTLGLAGWPVAVRTRGDDLLTVRPAAGGPDEGMVLTGPAAVSFEGEVMLA